MSKRSIFLSLLIFLFFISFSVQAKEYEVMPSSTLRLKAKITGGGFESKNSKLQGSAVIDEKGDTLVRVIFKAPSDAFESGVGMRDRHMAEKENLDASKYPWVQFVLAPTPQALGFNVNELEPGIVKELNVKGFFFARGKRKEQSVQVKLRKQSDGGIELICYFEMNIEDFEIKPPNFLFVEMDPVIKAEAKLQLQLKQSGSA